MAAPTHVPTAAPLRLTYLACGMGCVALGFIGQFVPVLPTTIFYILALFCFKRSSPKLEAWLLDRPVVGPILREWDRTKSLRPATKRLILTVLWLGLAVSAALVHKPTVWAILAACGIGVTWYIVTRPVLLDPETPVP